ncbi:MAG: tRNA lysidine(34) synthetase TilS, partial [Spirochaetaceae bacterium]|nr:tRNA lysidine(34) synthetase TilS [Spirochaetaceae bacterium]
MPGSFGPKSLEGEIRAFLAERRLEAERPALVGLSGGADSTALLAALVALGPGALRAVHVDHGLRPRRELDAELALVRALCRRLGVPLTVARVRVGAVEALARATGEGVEAAARRYRHAAFRAVLAREGLDRIYLAHTLDDQLETLLMRRLAGAGSAGGRGIPAVSGPILRPFLGLRKEELLAYLAERDIPYATDSTNASPEYLRNRTRLLLVPLLDRDFPGWRGGLLAGSERAAEDEAALAAW